MTRLLYEKLRLLSSHSQQLFFSSRLTRFLSLKLPHFFSLSSTLQLCKSLARAFASKTLAFFSSMDDPFSSLDDPWSDNYRSRPLRTLLDGDDDDYDFDASASDSNSAIDKLYLVPYRWWKEAQRDDDNEIGGVLYSASLNDDIESEIVLDLRKKEDSRNAEKEEEGFSGREYALLPKPMWLWALKRHNDLSAAVYHGSLCGDGDSLQDIFPIQIRLFVLWETNSLVVKISQKDNVLEFYKRACKIFSSKSAPLNIWDFSGQTTQFFLENKINLLNESSGQAQREILLELQVYGFSDTLRGIDERNNEMALVQSKMEVPFCSGSLKMNGSTDKVGSLLTLTSSSQSGGSYRGAASLGLTGLQNLGNTCFMNSAIQCLVHTPELVDYFLGDYPKEINYDNPLGMKGELALAFGDLLRKLWAPGARPVAPRMFKSKLANFAPQFSGYNQHDSQEFLAFLLDGLHEDLNRVKCKPYIEAKGLEDRPDEEAAEEHWKNHLARNDSIIVDSCQGQFRSTLICPLCKKVSVTFDPFMYLSLPLPSTVMRTMTLTVMSADGITLPSTYTITVPDCGKLTDLILALSAACSLRDDETLLVAEVYMNRMLSWLEPSGLIALIRDDDKLVAYRLPKDCEKSPLVVFKHKKIEHWPYKLKMFGIPLVARLPDLSCGSDIRKKFLQLLNPFLMPIEDVLNDYDDEEGSSGNEDSDMLDATSPTVLDTDAGSDSETLDETHLGTDFQFQIGPFSTEIKMDEPFQVSGLAKELEVHVVWSDKMIDKYDTCILSSFPEVFKPQTFMKRPQESVSLYKCLEAFLKEEPLGPEDMWYCPSCKEPRQAIKKLDLWRLPEILVIHLKRFSYNRYFKNKLETFVDFPVDYLDFSTYIAHKNSQFSNHYILYAISNHYGGLGGGHYTASINLGYGMWYEFDDEKVDPVSEDRIKTSAAYVLFYRRVPDV
ncbi:ubiquitin carboxyl-terminal hydrolase 8-like [Quercus lobata]|uniref:ubiquitin carboxyl-terminal hydrolase 8-like n=1 Tax=Quercus lobata TaxID=97700 RepID=UPI001248AFA1|nr:ubiquitin carboxyl-terminal hydrolase 8-like [Quercus lobata]